MADYLSGSIINFNHMDYQDHHRLINKSKKYQSDHNLFKDLEKHYKEVNTQKEAEDFERGHGVDPMTFLKDINI